ncbi:MAG: hypothetical protein SGCHY_005413 [Lobulomycetales sp.]
MSNSTSPADTSTSDSGFDFAALVLGIPVALGVCTIVGGLVFMVVRARRNRVAGPGSAEEGKVALRNSPATAKPGMYKNRGAEENTAQASTTNGEKDDNGTSVDKPAVPEAAMATDLGAAEEPVSADDAAVEEPASAEDAAEEEPAADDNGEPTAELDTLSVPTVQIQRVRTIPGKPGQLPQTPAHMHEFYECIEAFRADHAAAPDELDLMLGDVLVQVSPHPDEPAWFIGYCLDSKLAGTFPAACVKSLTEEETRRSVVVSEQAGVMPKVRVDRMHRPESLLASAKRSSEHFGKKFSMTEALGATLNQLTAAMEQLSDAATTPSQNDLNL